MIVTHPIAPVYDENSRILILGSFPSVRSRAEHFYYAHPQNRFWPLIARICGENVPCGTDEKRALLLAHGIALWDCAASCALEGSSDASIRSVVPNDISPILAAGNIKAVFTNGGTAHSIYKRYISPVSRLEDICLPSTSPANASYSAQRLYELWNRELSAYVK